MNLETILILMALLLDCCTILFGIYAFVKGCMRLPKQPASGIKWIVFAIVWTVAAPLCCVFLVPWLMGRGLARALRKKNAKTDATAKTEETLDDQGSEVSAHASTASSKLKP